MNLARKIARRQRVVNLRMGTMPGGEGGSQQIITFRPPDGASLIIQHIAAATDLPIMETQEAIGLCLCIGDGTSIIAYSSGENAPMSFFQMLDGYFGMLPLEDCELRFQWGHDGRLRCMDSQSRVWPLRPEVFQPERDRAVALAQEHIELARASMARLGFTVPTEIEPLTICINEADHVKNCFADLVEWNMHGAWWRERQQFMTDCGLPAISVFDNVELRSAIDDTELGCSTKKGLTIQNRVC